jgi:hypothetical protein
MDPIFLYTTEDKQKNAKRSRFVTVPQKGERTSPFVHRYLYFLPRGLSRKCDASTLAPDARCESYRLLRHLSHPTPNRCHRRAGACSCSVGCDVSLYLNPMASSIIAQDSWYAPLGSNGQQSTQRGTHAHTSERGGRQRTSEHAHASKWPCKDRAMGAKRDA